MKFDKLFIHPEGDCFSLDLPKLIVLLGPNGAGKTTMLNAIEAEAEKKDDCTVINDDVSRHGDTIGNVFDPVHITSTRFSSEGESMIHSFGLMLGKVGRAAKLADKKIILCLDKVDSGLSFDRIQEMISVLTEYVMKDCELLAISANSYELPYLLKDVAKFYWIPTKEFIELGTFEEFVSMYK